MKITFIYPRIKQSDFGSGSLDYPIGILSLVSYLKQKNSQIDTEVIDSTFMKSWLEFKKTVKKNNADIFGFSFSSPLADDAYKAIKIVKNIHPKALIVAGGPHPTVDPIGTIKKGKVDIVVSGEGEEILQDIVEKFIKSQDLSLIQGTFIYKNKKILTNERQGFIKDLDKLPMPDRNLLEIERYLKTSGSLHIITSRGCPFNCFFCQPTQRKLFGEKVRYESPERVILEIEELMKNYGHKKFVLFFADDTFTFDKKRVKEICRLMVKKGFNKIPWWCHSRVNTFDEEIARTLKKSGCIGVSFGVESGSQRILNEVMKKGITVEQTIRAFKWCHKYNLLGLAYLMIGTPTETIDDLEATNRLIADIHPDIISISRTTPMLGSALYEYARKHKILNLKKSKDFGYYGEVKPLKLDKLTEEQIEFYKNKWARTWLFNLYKNSFKYIKLLAFSNARVFLLKSAFKTIKKKLKFLQ